MAKYSAAELRQMLAKGQAMKNPQGDPSFPIADEEDLSSAIHAVGLGGAANGAIRKYIMGRAKAMGKSSMIPDTWQADGSLASARADTPYTRSFALEDISIRSGGDGRTVEAYAAVFDTPTSIRDQDGEYEEVIDPTAFNRAIDHHQRAGHRIPVMFNHGLTTMGTPSDLGSMPIGSTEEIKADRRGLFTRARYNSTPLAEAALENIREGSISAYSFAGAFKRSTPMAPRGGKYRNGQTVRRTESTLREYGPTPFPAYQTAQIVGVRAEQALAFLGSLHPSELARLSGMIQSGTPLDPPDFGTPSDDGPAADDPPDGHSTRSPHDQIRAAYAQFLSRRGATE